MPSEKCTSLRSVTVGASPTAAAREPAVSTLELTPEPRSVRTARTWVVGELAAIGREDLADAAELGVSELVTNAVIHSGTSPRVTAQLDDERLLVSVQDRGSSGTARRTEDHEPTDISGRGLMLVEALATAWSAEHSADGTTVWFELDTGMPQSG